MLQLRPAPSGKHTSSCASCPAATPAASIAINGRVYSIADDARQESTWGGYNEDQQPVLAHAGAADFVRGDAEHRLGRRAQSRGTGLQKSGPASVGAAE